MSFTETSDSIVSDITGLANQLPVNPTAGLTPAPTIPTTIGPQFGTGPNGVSGTNAFAQVEQILGQFGLGGLSDWAKQQIQSGVTPDELMLNIRQTPEWQSRFWMISARQQAGLSPISEADVVNYENTAQQLAKQYGMPRAFLDDHTIGTLIANDWSPVELENVLKSGYDQVAKADPMVRAAFSHYFGPNSDQALAAFFVDPDKAEPILLQQAQAAVLGGNAARYGIGLTANDAMTLSKAGISLSQAETGFQDVNRLASLFQTDVGDKGPGLDKEAGVQARLMGNAGELDAEQQKLSARVATGQGKVGVEENPQKGFEGLGAAF